MLRAKFLMEKALPRLLEFFNSNHLNWINNLFCSAQVNGVARVSQIWKFCLMCMWFFKFSTLWRQMTFFHSCWDLMRRERWLGNTVTGAVTPAGWLAGCVQGPVYFFTLPIGLRNSDLPLDSLEVHSWGVWWFFGRRTQGPRRTHGRQWLLFGKLVMLDIRQFCWSLAGELTLVDRLVGTCCWAPLRTSVF